MEIKELFSKSKLTTRQLGDKIGLSRSQISQIATGNTEARPMIVQICRYVFWKELGIPQEEILKELNIDIPQDLSADIESKYENQIRELQFKVTQLEDERRVLFATIDNLHKQLNEK